MIEDILANNFGRFVVIFFCLFLTAFFAAAETAITSLGTLKAKHLVDSKGVQAKVLHLWLNRPGHVLTTILLYNNGLNILISALATVIAQDIFQNDAVGIATGATTFIVLIFGEIIPKSFGKTHTESLSIPALRFVQVFYYAGFPAIWMLSEVANYVLRKFGSEPKKVPPITEDELEFLVDEGTRTGVLKDLKREMLTGVFEFDETKVREIMTPRTDIGALSQNATVSEALNLVMKTGHSRVPIFDGQIDKIVGVVFAKDLLKFTAQHHNDAEQNSVTMQKLMRDVFFVPESKPIMEVFKDLKRTRNHLAIVIDEYGGTAGIVTMEDILEEIVGEIQDEYDIEEAEITEVESGVYNVAGSVNIDKFLDFFGLTQDSIKPPEQGVDTLAGWLTELLGDMPKVGQSVIIGPMNIEVTEVNRHRISRVRVIILKKSEENLNHASETVDIGK